MRDTVEEESKESEKIKRRMVIFDGVSGRVFYCTLKNFSHDTKRFSLSILNCVSYPWIGYKNRQRMHLYLSKKDETYVIMPNICLCIPGFRMKYLVGKTHLLHKGGGG